MITFRRDDGSRFELRRFVLHQRLHNGDWRQVLRSELRDLFLGSRGTYEWPDGETTRELSGQCIGSKRLPYLWRAILRWPKSFTILSIGCQTFSPDETTTLRRWATSQSKFDRWFSARFLSPRKHA